MLWTQGGWNQGGKGNQGYQGGGKGGYGGARGDQGGGKGGYQGWYPTGGNAGTKGGGKGGKPFVPISERNCFSCGGKWHIAKDCPGGANEVNAGPGGAEGVTGGEHPQGLGQPLPGVWSVEAPPKVTDERPEVKEE